MGLMMDVDDDVLQAAWDLHMSGRGVTVGVLLFQIDKSNTGTPSIHLIV